MSPRRVAVSLDWRIAALILAALIVWHIWVLGHNDGSLGTFAAGFIAGFVLGIPLGYFLDRTIIRPAVLAYWRWHGAR